MCRLLNKGRDIVSMEQRQVGGDGQEGWGTHLLLFECSRVQGGVMTRDFFRQGLRSPGFCLCHDELIWTDNQDSLNDITGLQDMEDMVEHVQDQIFTLVESQVWSKSTL